MANPEQVELVKRGRDAFREWRRHNRHAQLELDNAQLDGASLAAADLSGADLRRTRLKEASLIEANLSRANLSGANLAGAHLNGTNFSMADLSGAHLIGADLGDASVFGVNLSGAQLGGASLEGTDIVRSDLSGADLSGVLMWRTVLAFLDLRTVKGLETVKHLGPSSIGIETIYASKGEIPEVFLRGAGVPDSFITFAKSLVGSAIEFYSCFISYSIRDQAFADRLYADLQAHGVRCWFAPHDVKGGRKLHEQIDEAIRLYEKLLLILSPDSMSSEWVKTEIAKAQQRETRERVRMLFPISLAPFEAIRDWECFDADTGKDSAREIREYFIPDFSTWKDHDSYQREFDRLLRDLKSDAQISA